MSSNSYQVVVRKKGDTVGYGVYFRSAFFREAAAYMDDMGREDIPAGCEVVILLTTTQTILVEKKK